MFNLISKLLIFFLNPFNWILVLLVFSYLAKSKSRRIKWALGALLLFWFFGNRVIINQFYKWIEPAPLFQDSIKIAYEYGVVLGGGIANSNDLFPDRIFFGEHTNRLTESLELLQNNKIINLIISGGDGKVFGKKEMEANNILTYLNELKINSGNVFIEATSRNTYENAKYVKALLDSLHADGKILLISSAIHMPRAAACFAKQKILFDVYPADFQQKKDFAWTDYVFPSIRLFGDWFSLIKEKMGMIVYQWMGYI